jgi:hypothetical protein
MLMHSEAQKRSMHFCCIAKITNPNNAHPYALRGSGIVVETLDGYLCLVQPCQMLMLTEAWKRFSESEGESVRAANSKVPQAIVSITQLFQDFGILDEQRRLIHGVHIVHQYPKVSVIPTIPSNILLLIRILLHLLHHETILQSPRQFGKVILLPQHYKPKCLQEVE